MSRSTTRTFGGRIAFPLELTNSFSVHVGTELRQVSGLQSAAVRERLPRASEEAIHRDYFVLA